MPRRRRYFESRATYEVNFRVRSGLPFVCKELITLLLKSAIARTQRDEKVYLSHCHWMANHCHNMVVSRDINQLKNFYAEVQKKICDYIKRLLNLEQLDLWEGNISVIRIADFAAAKERIAYFYANPARANLVDSIEQYPGYTTHRIFQSARDSIRARHTELVPWIQCPAITPLPSASITETQDKFLTERLIKSARKKHKLTFHPNIWMRCFGRISPTEVKKANHDIALMIVALEDEARIRRAKENKTVLGARRLLKQPFMREHTPRKYGRRIFVIARDQKIRRRFIKIVQWVDDLCTSIYERWKRCDYSAEWPPGTFMPPRPLFANKLDVGWA